MHLLKLYVKICYASYKQATLSLLHHYTNQEEKWKEKWVEKWEGKQL